MLLDELAKTSFTELFTAVIAAVMTEMCKTLYMHRRCVGGKTHRHCIKPWEPPEENLP